MAYCVKCGAKVDDGVKFCTQCGAEIPNQQYEYGPQNSYHPQPYVDAEECFDPDEVSKNKAMGVLSYLGILVLIPILAGDKKSQYVKFHANQGLVLFIVSAVVDLLDGDWVWGLHSWINFGGSMFSWVFDILSFVCFILMVMGIVSACKGEKKELPMIGKIRLLR
ncbi:zinc-ribbon domain-containing protein, partial [Bariatricus sp. SGI.154]|uniref:DUF4870 domain-containing protein n=1 Tax=Bariatricus sp. SGI.154 TaxID=3420549 RepID=UPI003D088F7D